MLAKRCHPILHLNRALSTQSARRTLAQHASAKAKTRIAEIDSSTPLSSSLVDSYRRRHDYLRISITERCNLRCFYCMPSEGVELSSDGKLLTNAEIIRLATLFVKSGVTKIRLTGGEPTVRKGISEIIAELNQLRKFGLKSIAMTSNGLALHRRLPELIENGLTHLNLSLDTLDPFKFELMTRRRGHEAVLKTLDVALASSLKSVKLNVVVVKGLNDSEVIDFVQMTRDKPISVRFIEFMPFTGNKWDKHKMVPSSELLKTVSARFPEVNRVSDELNDTARSYQIQNYLGTFGFISSMSDHFCATCNRLRLTADGQIKVCLFDAKEVSLRDKMRRGITDDELLDTIGRAVWGKKEKHAGMEDIDVITNRPMILIGAGYKHTVFHAPRLLRSSQNNSSYMPDAPRYYNPLTTRSYTTLSKGLTHIDAEGRASMVDIGDKQVTNRQATAEGRIFIPKVAYELVTKTYPTTSDTTPTTPEKRAQAKSRRKGDALTVAQLAAIMGCKKTSELIPLCHPLAVSKVDVTVIAEPSLHSNNETNVQGLYSILCTATISCEGKTGVEMEALTAVSVGLLTVWDMLKAVAGKEMVISEIKVTSKTGGKSGDFVRE